MNEFFINRIFVINHVFYISIESWRVPIVENRCFIRDEIINNVHNSFINWCHLIINTNERMFMLPVEISVALFIRIALTVSYFQIKRSYGGR